VKFVGAMDYEVTDVPCRRARVDCFRGGGGWGGGENAPYAPLPTCTASGLLQNASNFVCTLTCTIRCPVATPTHTHIVTLYVYGELDSLAVSTNIYNAAPI
jgi:hypothetical protein